MVRTLPPAVSVCLGSVKVITLPDLVKVGLKIVREAPVTSGVPMVILG